MEKAGMILLFAGQKTPKGWYPCDGRLLKINDYQLLYAILGTSYGGDSKITFGIPKLDNVNGLRYLICANGTFNGMKLSYQIDPSVDECTIAFVQPFSGDTVPNGWALCDGKVLKIQDYRELYSLTDLAFTPAGTQYGSFSLPKTDKPHIICVSGNYPNI